MNTTSIDNLIIRKFIPGRRILGAFIAALLTVGAMQSSAQSFNIAGPANTNVDTNPATHTILNVTQTGTISNLSLSVNVGTPYADDVSLFLFHAGVTVQVYVGVGDTGGSVINATFSDQAGAAAPVNGSAIGTFTPNPGLLSAFNGLQLAGAWDLQTLDTVVPNDGTPLLSWSIFGTIVEDLSLVLDMRGIDQGVFDTATRDVNSRLFRLRLRSTQGGANIGLAAAYGSQGRELISLGVDGKQTVNKETSPAPYRYEIFAQGDFSTTDRETTSAAAGFGGWTEAGTAGIEYSLSDRLTTGFAVGYVHNNTDIANGVGSIDIDGVAASLYASWFKDDFYVDGLYSFSWLENDLKRNTAAGVATAKPDSYGNTVALNTGYNFMNYPGIVAGPIAELKYTHGEIDSFTDSAGVAVQSQDYDSLISQFGWQASFPRTVNCCRATRLTPQLHAAWAHQYMNKAEFVGATFGGFTATGRTPEPTTDYAALGGGVLAEFGDRFSVTLDYQADVGKNEVTHFVSLRGGFKF